MVPPRHRSAGIPIGSARATQAANGTRSDDGCGPAHPGAESHGARDMHRRGSCLRRDRVGPARAVHLERRPLKVPPLNLPARTPGSRDPSRQTLRPLDLCPRGASRLSIPEGIILCGAGELAVTWIAKDCCWTASCAQQSKLSELTLHNHQLRRAFASSIPRRRRTPSAASSSLREAFRSGELSSASRRSSRRSTDRTAAAPVRATARVREPHARGRANPDLS